MAVSLAILSVISVEVSLGNVACIARAPGFSLSGSSIDLWNSAVSVPVDSFLGYQARAWLRKPAYPGAAGLSAAAGLSDGGRPSGAAGLSDGRGLVPGFFRLS